MGTRLEIVAEPGKSWFSFRRVLNGPRALVWEAMTKPEHLARWYGPRALKTASVEIDFRVGGTWRVVLRAPDGNEAAFRGIYREIVPLEKIVQTWIFELMPDESTIETLTFEDQGGKTVVHGHVQHKNVENRDGHLKAMEPGASETWDRLEELLAAMKS